MTPTRLDYEKYPLAREFAEQRREPIPLAKGVAEEMRGLLDQAQELIPEGWNLLGFVFKTAIFIRRPGSNSEPKEKEADEEVVFQVYPLITAPEAGLTYALLLGGDQKGKDELVKTSVTKFRNGFVLKVSLHDFFPFPEINLETVDAVREPFFRGLGEEAPPSLVRPWDRGYISRKVSEKLSCRLRFTFTTVEEMERLIEKDLTPEGIFALETYAGLNSRLVALEQGIKLILEALNNSPDGVKIN